MGEHRKKRLSLRVPDNIQEATEQCPSRNCSIYKFFIVFDRLYIVYVAWYPYLIVNPITLGKRHCLTPPVENSRKTKPKP